MNELRVNDMFRMEPVETMMRRLLGPWRADLEDTTPQIRLDVSEKDGSYAVKAEIPGVNKDDIDVRIDGDLVTISAEVKAEHDEKKDGRLVRAERRYGYASRSFSLGQQVDQAKVEATYKDGVLQLTLPKLPGTTAKRVPIS
jgi:HSP20 family protein